MKLGLGPDEWTRGSTLGAAVDGLRIGARGGVCKQDLCSYFSNVLQRFWRVVGESLPSNHPAVSPIPGFTFRHTGLPYPPRREY